MHHNKKFYIAYLRGLHGERFNEYQQLERKSRSKKKQAAQGNSNNSEQSQRSKFIRKDGHIPLDRLREDNQAETATFGIFSSFDTEASGTCNVAQECDHEDSLPGIEDIFDDIENYFDDGEEEMMMMSNLSP